VPPCAEGEKKGYAAWVPAGRRLQTDDDLRALLSELRRVAVLGIKTETQATAPAFRIPEYLVAAGFDVVPVPVYFADVKTILGREVYRTLAAVPPPKLDLVDVFRRPEDLMPHLADVLVARPKAVWLQSGIVHREFTGLLLTAGIDVVEDRCIMVEHRRLR
jgi:uncharacterized protein